MAHGFDTAWQWFTKFMPKPQHIPPGDSQDVAAIANAAKLLSETISRLAAAIESQAGNTKEMFEWIKSHANLATKHDLQEMEKRIMAKEQDVLDALAKIDAATTRAGANIQTIANVTQTISDEQDALLEALKNAGVSQALVDQAASLGDRTQAISDALDAHAVFLNAIAAKGAVNPVPVPVPDPVPV